MTSRPRPDSNHWTSINELLKRVDPADPDSLRDAVAALYAMVAGLPDQLLQDFEGFSESQLDTGLVTRALLVSKRTIAVQIGKTPVETLLDAVRLLRALEENFIELCPYIVSDLDEDLESLWVTSDQQYFVIPRQTALVPLAGRPFLRRALRHCRVIPTQIDSFAVRLHGVRSLSDAASAEAMRTEAQTLFGAALFPGLTVELDESSEGLFTVIGLGGFDAAKLVCSQLDAARAAHCRAVVWGELTMPEASIQLVRKHLSEGVLEHGCRHQYLVVGSWHRAVEGRMRNVSRILDGRGETLFELFKWAKFKIRDRREAIEPGDEVHLLLGEGELTVFAICRDFLQETSEVPYRNLNVDLALVPSMTTAMPDPNTMLGHAAAANTMRVRFGTRTLVVAQPANACRTDVIGEVMAFPARPLRDGTELVCDPLHLCLLET